MADKQAALSVNELHTVPQWLTTLIESELGMVCSLSITQALAQCGRYDRSNALRLIDMAKGLFGESWPERQLAVLLLENQFFHLCPDNITEFDLILVHLGLKPKVGTDVPLHSSLLEEGYSSLEIETFVVELKRRLGRLNRIHRRILAGQWDQDAWHSLILTSREPCKLALARYLFTPAEIAEDIQKTAILTQGAKHTLARVHGLAEFVCSGDISDAPPFEREILRHLCADNNIYWVAEQTSSELNALVEYPLTSAVLVIKPPGSDREFEFKRAGTRGARKLNIIYERNGKHAPVSHRLHGGSLGWLGRRESRGSALFSKIYRLVHQKESPCSRTVAVSSIAGVPTPQGERHILDYFTHREAFGDDGFEEMRHALQECVKAFPVDTDMQPASFTGEEGETLQFIGQAQTQQAIIFGSSSFRLDRIALYLSAAGPEEYFRNGLQRDYQQHDAIWLADTVLEEILGLVYPPESFSTYREYVQAAFALPENRKRADAVYLSLMAQIGECWGTLLGVRGYSDGESFVLRNVGLKSQWQNGEWQVRVIFMDHDDLAIAGKGFQHFWPLRAIPGMMRDQVHILGGPLSGNMIPGEIGTLAKIYRVNEELAAEGLTALKQTMKQAYDKTQTELKTNEELKDLFFPDFIERLGDFDQLVTSFLKTDQEQQDSWASDAEAYLQARGYPETLASDYLKAIPHFHNFFRRTAFLYSSK